MDLHLPEQVAWDGPQLHGLLLEIGNGRDVLAVAHGVTGPVVSLQDWRIATAQWPSSRGSPWGDSRNLPCGPLLIRPVACSGAVAATTLTSHQPTR